MGATRTWVSGVGDDANPCSRTAPCKTFPGAISKTAARGEIDTLDPGGFGSVTIAKAITIDDGIGPGLGGILAPGTVGVVIDAAPTHTFTLRSLSISGAGTGIAGVRIISAGTVIIENCAIFGFWASAGTDAGRGIRDGRRGGGKLAVTNCMIWDCSDAAIMVAPAS